MIRVEALTKVFEARKSIFSRKVGLIRVVDSVSVEIKKGEIFGLVGESGSGKQEKYFSEAGMCKR